MSAVQPHQWETAPSEPQPQRPDDRLETVFGVAACCLSAALAGVLAVLLTPLYLGAVIVPIAWLVAAAANAILPILVRSLTGSTMAAVLPVVIWVIMVLILSMPRPEGDVMLPGGSGGQTAVSYGVVLLGVLAGTVSIAVSGARSRRVRLFDPASATTRQRSNNSDENRAGPDVESRE